MATIKKVSKAKNISAGPSKKTPIAPKVDPKGQYTKVQERTLGNMKKGGKIKKYQNSGKPLRASADATRIDKPAINTRPATKYKNIDLFVPAGKKPTATDSSNYRTGYKAGIRGGDAGLFSDFQTHMGASEGRENYKKNSIKKEKTGGKVAKAKDGKWIQKAVNPKHKGYCTPMTKATCTPKRKALAMTFKKMAKARKKK